MKPVKNGIFQGSFISPIFVFFYLAGLLNILETPTNSIEIPENYVYNHSIHVSILIYVNDRKLTVFLYLLDTNNYVLAKAYQLVGQWLHLAELSSDKNKRELMHYTQRKRDKISPYINLTNHNSTISTILVGLTICWLEVYFDCKLLYNYHIIKIAVKAENAIAYTVQGLLYYHLYLLYYTCILPIITYTGIA